MEVKLCVLSSLVVAMVMLSGHSCSGRQAILRAPKSQMVNMGGNATFMCEADPTVPALLDILLVIRLKNGETLTVRNGMKTQQFAERGVSILTTPVLFEIGVTILGSQENNGTTVSCKVLYYRTEMSPLATLTVRGVPGSGRLVEKTDNVSVSFVHSRNSVFEGVEVDVCLNVTGSIIDRGDKTITITSDSTGTSSHPVIVQVPLAHTGEICHTLPDIVTDDVALNRQDRKGFTLHLQSTSPAVSCVEPCTAEYVIIDDDIVYLEFADSAYTVHEGDDLQQVCVELVSSGSDTIQRPVVFQVEATSGTAAAGEDFSASVLFPQIGYFNIGARNRDRWCLSVPINDDSIAEEDEVFSVSLFVSDVQVVPIHTSVDVTIIDNDEI